MKETYYSVNDRCKMYLSFMDSNQIFAPYGRMLSSSNNTACELLKKYSKEAPDDIALELSYNFNEEMKLLKQKSVDVQLYKRLKSCCFKINPFLHRFDNDLLKDSELVDDSYEKTDLVLLKTHCFNYSIINAGGLHLLSYFNGTNTLADVYAEVKNSGFKILVLNGDMAKHSWKVSIDKEEREINNEIDFLLILSFMCRSNLIELCNIHTYDRNSDLKQMSLFQTEKCCNVNTSNVLKQHISSNTDKKNKSILLLAATPGSATIGLLYIASYLKRNDVNVVCKYNNLDVDNDTLRYDLEKLIHEFHPDVIGVSIKWFVHMARGLEICRIIKSISEDIEVVVGGNTASIYNEEFIAYDFIDYVVCGDGEVPILEICQGKDDIQNCIYKKDGKIVENPITYIQNNQNSQDIYLSDLNEILISKECLYNVPNYYIYTGKGCQMNCFYCGGCSDAQKEQFKRTKPFLRDVNEVRMDLIELKKFASTFMFIDSFEIDVLHYYQELWADLDLSNYFCHFYFYKVPDAAFIDILTDTFKYIYINIDLCSLSQRHREQLNSLNLSKPLPSDRDLLNFLSICDSHRNTEVSISLISGLPYFTKEDMLISESFLSKLMSHSSFKSAEWGRLHAQPGAPIVNSCDTYDMYSQATDYNEFLQFSDLNMNQDIYPDVYSFKFPYINFHDDAIQNSINEHYNNLYRLIKENCSQDIDNFIAYDRIQAGELQKRVSRLVEELKRNKVDETSLVCILDKESINMVISILAVIEIRADYILIDPEMYDNMKKKIIKENSVTAEIVDAKAFFSN